jgi:hypothetical protein
LGVDGAAAAALPLGVVALPSAEVAVAAVAALLVGEPTEMRRRATHTERERESGRAE